MEDKKANQKLTKTCPLQLAAVIIVTLNRPDIGSRIPNDALNYMTECNTNCALYNGLHDCCSLKLKG